LGTTTESGGPVDGGRQGRSLRRRDRRPAWRVPFHAEGSAMRRWASTSGEGGEGAGGWVVVPHGGGWQHGGWSEDAGGGVLQDRSPSPRLCVAVGIPGGGRRRDFQRVWEGPGVGVWWPGAFHTRSDSTAGVGGRFGSEIAAGRREGRGKGAACAGSSPECRGQSGGLGGLLRGPARPDFCSPHPCRSPSECSSRGWAAEIEETKPPTSLGWCEFLERAPLWRDRLGAWPPSAGP
jgi:hypothetical protein